MTNEEASRNTYYAQNRKPISPKSQVYSPSVNYNYNGNQSQHGNPTGHGNASYHNQQHPKRKSNQFKRDIHGFYDRICKQNDTIIRLLKEIRDRLPKPPEPQAQINEQTTDEVAGSASQADQTTIEQPTGENVAVETASPTESAGPVDNKCVEGAPREVSDEELDRQVNGNVRL